MSTGLPDLLRGALRVFLAVLLLAPLGTGAVAEAKYEYDAPPQPVGVTHDIAPAARTSTTHLAQIRTATLRSSNAQRPRLVLNIDVKRHLLAEDEDEKLRLCKDVTSAYGRSRRRPELRSVRSS